MCSFNKTEFFMTDFQQFVLDFKSYVNSLLKEGIDPQNAFEAAVDEFEIDWDDQEMVTYAEEWFLEVEQALI
jgi:hypothetical protein